MSPVTSSNHDSPLLTSSSTNPTSSSSSTNSSISTSYKNVRVREEFSPYYFDGLISVTEYPGLSWLTFNFAIESLKKKMSYIIEGSDNILKPRSGSLIITDPLTQELITIASYKLKKDANLLKMSIKSEVAAVSVAKGGGISLTMSYDPLAPIDNNGGGAGGGATFPVRYFPICL